MDQHPSPPIGSNSMSEMPDEAAPSYSLPFEDTWKHWTAIQDAERHVFDEHGRLDAVKDELEVARTRLASLSQESSNMFATMSKLSKRSSFFRIPFKRGESSQNGLSKREVMQHLEGAFAKTHEEISRAQDDLEHAVRIFSLRDAKLSELNNRIHSFDQCFEDLRVAFQVPSMAEAIEELEEVEERARTCQNLADCSKQLATHYQRATVTIQHAHHYFLGALQVWDGLRGPPGKGKAITGKLGDMSTAREYQAGVMSASKAQVCLNETFRVLELCQQMESDTMPPEIQVDKNVLKELGLLHISSASSHLYGWKPSRSEHLARFIQTVHDKQNEAFERLTRLAVWIQDRSTLMTEEANRSSAVLKGSKIAMAEKMHIIWTRQIAALGS